MSLLRLRSGKALSTGTARRVMATRPVTSGGGGGSGGNTNANLVSTITGNLAVWYDAGTLTTSGTPNMTNGAGAVTAWSSAVTGFNDKSGSGRNGTINAGTTIRAIPHVVSTGPGTGLGGAQGEYIAESGGLGNYNLPPRFDNAFSVQTPAITLGSVSSWVLYLVFSRGNLAQDYCQDLTKGYKDRFTNRATNLFTHGSTVLASIGNTGTNDTITIPGNTPLAANLSERFTHALTLAYDAGTGKIAAYLNGNVIGSNLTNPLSGSTPAALKILDGSACYFHEFACWQRAFTSGDFAALLTGTNNVASRWPRGVRTGNIFFLFGQSNADGHFYGGANNNSVLQPPSAALRYHLGAVHVAIIHPGGTYMALPNGAGTTRGGTGIAEGDGTGWLDPRSFTSWAAAPDGAMATAFKAIPALMTANDRAAYRGSIGLWCEQDTNGGTFMDKVPYLTGALPEMAARMRSAFGKTAAQAPMYWFMAWYGGFQWPWGNPNQHINGVTFPVQGFKRGLFATAALTDGSNIRLATYQSGDAWPNSATQDSNGAYVGANPGSHPDGRTWTAFYSRAPHHIAADLLRQSGYTDVAVPTVPVAGQGVERSGGPKIISARWEDGTFTKIIVTVQHDGGTDLVVNANAALGYGWSLLDGGFNFDPSEYQSRNWIGATACQRLSATTLRVTLQNAPSAPSVSQSKPPQLFYPFDRYTIGAGDMVTDNVNQLTQPYGWNAKADLGSAYDFGFPIQDPADGITLT